MLRYFFLSLLAGICATGNISAQDGIPFFHGTLKEAMDQANQNDQLIFVDAFAKWCGPCKRMAATVFVDPQVGRVMADGFVNMKIDMEEELGFQFGKEYPVSAYPTLFFINPADGKVIKKHVGGLSVEQFLDLVKNVRGSIDNSAQFAEKWEAGERTAEVALGYVRALNRAGKPSLAVANTYFSPGKSIETNDELHLLFESTTEADSRLFDLFIKNRKALATLKGEEACTRRIEMACQRTAQKAMEFKNVSLWQEAVSKMKSHHPGSATAFEGSTGMALYETMADPAKYMKFARVYLSAFAREGSKYDAVARRMVAVFSTDKNVIKEAVKFSETAAKLEPGSPEIHLALAQMYQKAGNRKAALETAFKAKALAEIDSKKLLPAINQLIDQLNNPKS
jgi:thiol-disulfide isomerase/thioredoxin